MRSSIDLAIPILTNWKDENSSILVEISTPEISFRTFACVKKAESHSLELANEASGLRLSIDLSKAWSRRMMSVTQGPGVSLDLEGASLVLSEL